MTSFPYGKKILYGATLAALLISLPACVTSRKDFDQLRSQVYYQEQERVKLQERVDKLEAELARSQPAQANNWAELNTMRSQIATINGQLDDIRRHQETQQGAPGGAVTLDAVNAKVQELERRNMFMASQLGVVFDEMPQAQPQTQAPAMTPPTQSAPPAVSAPQQAPAAIQQPQAQPAAPSVEQPAGEAQGQELYQKALENFYAMKYKQAQTMWAEFVKGFPKDPLVPNAVFWQGECFFQLQDYANAALTYQKVIEDHSKSNKYRPALLKQGISFYKLKKDQAGKLVLEDLIKKYPDSAEAKRAQAYLKEGN